MHSDGAEALAQEQAVLGWRKYAESNWKQIQTVREVSCVGTFS